MMHLRAIAWSLLLLFPVSAMAQLSAELSVDVTQTDDIYSYEYTISNSFLSSVSINYFFLDVVNGGNVVIGEDAPFSVKSLNAPDNWIGEYTPYELELGEDFEAVGIKTDSLTGEPEPNRTEEVIFLSGDGFSLDDDTGNIFEGQSLSFTIESTYAPDKRDFDVGSFSPLLEILGSVKGQIDAPSIPPVPSFLACDFNKNGVCDVTDIDLLGMEIVAATNQAAFDMTSDGLVNQDDIDAFLSHEAVMKLNGDADLNGDVSFLDFLKFAGNFGQAGGPAAPWSQGNFIVDDEVNFLDFLELANNFGKTFESADAASAVPEPASHLHAFFALVVLWRLRTRRR